MGAGQCIRSTKISFHEIAKYRRGHTEIKIICLKAGQAPIQGTLNIFVITIFDLGSKENFAPRNVWAFDTVANLSFIAVISCCIDGPVAIF